MREEFHALNPVDFWLIRRKLDAAVRLDGDRFEYMLVGPDKDHLRKVYSDPDCPPRADVEQYLREICQ